IDIFSKAGRLLRSRSGMMNGQWLGAYTAIDPGLMVIDIDDMGTHYEGRAYIYDNRPDVPSTFVFFKTVDTGQTFKATIPVLPIDPRTGEPTTWPQLAPSFPKVKFPS